MIKPVLLGEAPSRQLQHQWDRPLSGPISETICKLAGLDREVDTDHYHTLTKHFTCMNVIERYEDAYPWTVETDRAARHRWWSWLLDWVANPINDGELLRVICLGRHAASACSMGRVMWGSWRNMEGSRVYYVVIPHPSGLNRLYNDREMTRLVSKTLGDALS